MGFVSITKGLCHILYEAELFDDPDEIAFDSASWANRDSIMGFAEGRGTTFFVNFHDISLALRHYHRGGLVSRYMPDRYIWTGLKRTRAWRELHLLQQMRELDLPVPRPIAARVIRQGLLYTADIMTERIPHSRTVAQLLSARALAASEWHAMGSLIRRFHEQGVYHADLNANNILLDDAGNFYLIDFDRGTFKGRRRFWQRQNLERLHRSLAKLKGKLEPFYFSQPDWNNLLEGYQQGRE